MNDFFRKVFEGNGVSPSDVCQQAFNQNFENAIKVEWFKRKNIYEAVFYQNNLEHIAMFSLTGVLKEYRLNIPESYLPENIKEIVSLKGEIMNSVMRNKGNMMEYEVIIRDKELNRHLITILDIGRIIEERRL